MFEEHSKSHPTVKHVLFYLHIYDVFLNTSHGENKNFHKSLGVTLISGMCEWQCGCLSKPLRTCVSFLSVSSCHDRPDS